MEDIYGKVLCNRSTKFTLPSKCKPVEVHQRKSTKKPHDSAHPISKGSLESTKPNFKVSNVITSSFAQESVDIGDNESNFDAKENIDEDKNPPPCEKVDSILMSLSSDPLFSTISEKIVDLNLNSPDRRKVVDYPRTFTK